MYDIRQLSPLKQAHWGFNHRIGELILDLASF